MTETAQPLIRIVVTDVTDTASFDEHVPGSTLVATLVAAAMERLQLPAAPYALRADDGKWLIDDQPLADQLQPTAPDQEARLTITPRSHLG